MEFNADFFPFCHGGIIYTIIYVVACNWNSAIRAGNQHSRYIMVIMGLAIVEVAVERVAQQWLL